MRLKFKYFYSFRGFREPNNEETASEVLICQAPRSIESSVRSEMGAFGTIQKAQCQDRAAAVSTVLQINDD